MANEFIARNGLIAQNNSTVTGSLTITQGITGSLLGTASYASQALSSSFASTASYWSGSILNATSASYAATASYVLNAISSSYTLTSSYLDTLNQDLTFNGNLTLNGTASVAYLNVTYESASVIYSSGSNQLGDAVNDTQILIGTVKVSGSFEVTGSTNIPSLTGSLLGTSSYATQALSASYSPSTSPFPFTGSAEITGSLGVTGSISAKALGALSTDVIFKIRNSANTTNIVEIRGDSETRFNSTTPAVGNYVAIKNYTSYDATIDLMGGDNVKCQIFNDMNSNLTLNRGLNIWHPGIVGGSTAKINNIVKSGLGGYGVGYGFNWAFTSNVSGVYTQPERAMWLTHQKSLVFYTGSVTPTDQHNEKEGSFEIYASASSVTNGIAAHFNTNSGSTVWIGTQTKLFNITASSITSSFTGSLLGTASYVSQALSSSFATTASYALTAETLLGSVVSASYAATASMATSSSFATTASFATFAPENSATSGVGTNPTTTSTQTVTHGLGRTPIKIRIYTISQFTNNASGVPTPFSIGTYTSSGNRCLYQPYDPAAITGAEPSATSTTFAAFITSTFNWSGSGIIQNVGATTFDIAWTFSGAGTAAARNYLWEAE